MTTYSTEAIVDAAIDALGAGLGASLAAVYATEADADASAGRVVAYDVPKPGLVEAGGSYAAGGARELIAYPTIEVAIPDLTLSNFDLTLTEADGIANLVVLAWEQSGDMVLLYRKLTRLVAAIYDVLIAPGVLLDARVKTARAAWRYNPENKEADQIQSGGLLVLGLDTLRTRP